MLHTRRSLIGISRQELALTGVTALWGGTFVVVHVAVQVSGPLIFAGARFLAAGLLSAVIFHRHLRGFTSRELFAGLLIGISLFAGYGLQTFGLQTITASASAFITATYVPLVPVLAWVVFKKRPGPRIWLGVVLAFVGLILIASPFATDIGFGIGEIATLISAIAIAAEILLITHFAATVNTARVTVLQLLVAGALGCMFMPVFGEAIPRFSWVWVAAAIGLGVASCLIQLTMNWAQRSVDETRATLIYAAEPVCGALFGRMAGDRLPALALAGGVHWSSPRW